MLSGSFIFLQSPFERLLPFFLPFGLSRSSTFVGQTWIRFFCVTHIRIHRLSWLWKGIFFSFSYRPPPPLFFALVQLRNCAIFLSLLCSLCDPFCLLWVMVCWYFYLFMLVCLSLSRFFLEMFFIQIWLLYRHFGVGIKFNVHQVTCAVDLIVFLLGLFCVGSLGFYQCDCVVEQPTDQSTCQHALPVLLITHPRKRFVVLSFPGLNIFSTWSVCVFISSSFGICLTDDARLFGGMILCVGFQFVYFWQMKKTRQICHMPFQKHEKAHQFTLLTCFYSFVCLWVSFFLSHLACHTPTSTHITYLVHFLLWSTEKWLKMA